MTSWTFCYRNGKPTHWRGELLPVDFRPDFISALTNLFTTSVGIHLFLLRALRRESEMQIQKLEWKLASKMPTIELCCLFHSFVTAFVSLLLVVFFRAYWGLRNHFPSEADALYNSLESSYQRTLQSCLKSSGSVASLPQSDRSSSSSQESLK